MASQASTLYTPQLLGLAAELYHFPFDPGSAFIGRARSQTCGSEIEMSADTLSDGSMARIGMTVKACAIGQASAAILAQSAINRSPAELAEIDRQIESWLSADAPLPDWPGFEALEPVLPHTGRHGALLIPWKAINHALSSLPSAG